MATKEELKTKAESLGIKLEGNEKSADIQALINTAEGNLGADAPGPDNEIITPPISTKNTPSEVMVPLSDVKKMIADAMQGLRDESKPIKPKKVTEHYAHVWRFEGQWVVDFVDRNKDPYVKQKIHAFQKFNEQKREFEAWIQIKLAPGIGVDGEPREERTVELPLNRYVERRVLVYCPIIKRHKHDTSYSIGEVEKKKEDSKTGLLVGGTGIMIDQEVEQYYEVFEVKTPDGEVRMIPDYAIC